MEVENINHKTTNKVLKGIELEMHFKYFISEVIKTSSYHNHIWKNANEENQRNQ